MKTKFREGQRVYSTVHGWGVVTRVSDVPTTIYSVAVDFNDGVPEPHTKDGRLYENAKITLFSEEEMKAEQKKKRWRGERLEKYWCIFLWKVMESSETGSKEDDWHYEMGNYFRTKEWAEERLQQLLKVLKKK